MVEIPEAMMPPAGKCRIWMLNVPAKQQPAATDCTTAMRQKPANAVLVFGAAVRDLSPFEARESWRRRATAEDGRLDGRLDDEQQVKRGRSDRDSASRSDERGRTDSAAGVPARRVESREAESRRAEPPKAERRPEPRKPNAQRAERRPEPRKPSAQRVERRSSTSPQAERRPAPTRTRTPPKPTKKPERP